jgi:hypothetical protein
MAKSKKFKSMNFKSKFSGKSASSLESRPSAKKSSTSKSSSGPKRKVVHKAAKWERNLRRNIRKGKLG